VSRKPGLSGWRVWRTWLLVAGLVCCGPVWAHGGLGDAKSIWGGAQHFLTSPLSLAALLGLAAALFGTTERVFFPAIVLAGVCAAGAAALAGGLPSAAAPAAIVLIGLAAVAGWTPTRAAALALAVVGGSAAGLAADLDARSWQGSIGVAAALMLPLFGALAASEDLIKLPRLAAILPIARRVLGSWVAAMGLLMTALAFHVSKG
jgi:hypothetical protein